MDDKQIASSISGKTIVSGDVFGYAVNYNQYGDTHIFNRRDMKELESETWNIIVEEIGTYKENANRVIEIFKKKTGVLQYAHMTLILVDYKELFIKINQEKLNIANTLMKELLQLVEDGKDQWEPDKSHALHKEYVKKRKDIFNRVYLKLCRIALLKRLKKARRKSIVLIVDEFYKEYFFKIPASVKSIISQKQVGTNDINYGIIHTYDIPFVISSREIKDDTPVIINGSFNKMITNPDKARIKRFKKSTTSYIYRLNEKPIYNRASRGVNFYMPLVDDRRLEYLRNSHWYDGAIFYTEYTYVTKGGRPTVSELTEIYRKVFRAAQGKRLIFRLPDFRPEKPVDYLDEKVWTDIRLFVDFDDSFNDCLISIALAAKEFDAIANVAVPMLRMGSELPFWRDMIEGAFEACDAQKPEFGACIETESAFEFTKDFYSADFFITGIDGLIEEIDDDYTKYDYYPKVEFKQQYHFYLRDVHQGIRMKHKSNVVTGKVLGQPEILDRMFKMGVRNTEVPITKMRQAEVFIKEEHFDHIGRFVGIHDQRPERRRRIKIAREAIRIKNVKLQIEAERKKVQTLREKQEILKKMKVVSRARALANIHRRPIEDFLTPEDLIKHKDEIERVKKEMEKEGFLVDEKKKSEKSDKEIKKDRKKTKETGKKRALKMTAIKKTANKK